MTHAIETLSGQQLEWTLCLALKKPPKIVPSMGVAYKDVDDSFVKAEFSSDAQAGIIAGQHWIGIDRPSTAQKQPTWQAITDDKTPPRPHRWQGPVVAYGATLGEAVGRAFAISVLGKTVEIPEELCNA